MRDLKRCIYTSSYDRGLEHLLKLWPDVVREIPDANLHCFYGWQLFDQFYSGNPASMKWKENMVNMMKEKGITDHGRVPQPELVKEYEKSGIWAYPTHFGEINCISAIKAQAYGCEPVVVNYAALKETVQFGRKVEGDIYDQETKDEFKKQLILALKNPLSDVERLEMQKWANDTYKWSKIAKNWDKLFKEGD
jgi:glycosyltransferase involved in cell wall biosynthesis